MTKAALLEPMKQMKQMKKGEHADLGENRL